MTGDPSGRCIGKEAVRAFNALLEIRKFWFRMKRHDARYVVSQMSEE